ncbi:MAG: hypothetical protein PHX18_08675 [Candidatus Gastranaerophilales bacterium]|nr:hypothetical protein [Candidatus Gastranaerophilales bacterium]
MLVRLLFISLLTFFQFACCAQNFPLGLTQEQRFKAEQIRQSEYEALQPIVKELNEIREIDKARENQLILEAQKIHEEYTSRFEKLLTPGQRDIFRKDKDGCCH